MIYTIGSFNIKYQHEQLSEMIKLLELKERPKLLICESQRFEEDVWKLLLAKYPKVKIIIYSKAILYDNKDYFQLGCDYFISDMTELHAVVEMLVLRYKIAPLFTIDVEERRVYCEGSSFRLSPKEFSVFIYLWNKQGEYCSREEILVEVLGYDKSSTTRLVDVYIKHIRSKLEGYPAKIETARKKGYLLTTD